MAMTLASPSASPSPSDATRTNTTTTTTNVKNESNTTAPVKEDTTTTPSVPAEATNTNPSAANIKRKPSRRANTAERRATHNAVERQRRETLNGRFLDLAQLLPNLSQIRRPSKSSIVNSSIAHIHASRRHRMLASRELRQLKAEADALRREVNEWRSRQNLPLVDEPARSDGFNIIISGELDVLVAEMGAEMAAQGHGNLAGVGGSSLMDVEEDEDIDDWGPAPPSSHGGPPPPHAGGYPAGPGGQYDEEVFVPQAPIHHQQQHPVHHPQGMMMNGHHGHHPQHHPQHPMHHYPQQQHVQHHMQQQQFGYHPSQGPHPPFAPGSLEDDRHFLKNGGGNPFAHNIAPTRSYDSPTQGPGAGALFTPPATRDGLPPNGVAGLTKGPMNINTNVGGASPAQSVQSVHSAHSPASHHSGIALNGQGAMNGEVGTPPPPSAISQHFSARSGSGSPVGGYELASSNGSQQPPMERRATYPGPGGPPMMYGPTGEMYPGGGGHPMHEMRGGHEMRHHAHHPMHGPGGGGHDMRGHGHDMRGDMRQHGPMVGAGSGGGGLFGMML